MPEPKSPGAHKRLPEWLRRPPSRLNTRPSELHGLKKTLRNRKLATVCESARCPNIGECFTTPTATFMILGEICTRSCAFCNVEGGVSTPVDPNEPQNIAQTALEMGLKHVVITSVTRDDLLDGGASQFALTIQAIRDTIPRIGIELLVPDFHGDFSALETVIEGRPDILNHNLETVPSLYSVVRPQGDYERSLTLLRRACEAGLPAKSGIMVGLGETAEEVRALMADLAAVGCSMMTIGQYLRPTRENLPVVDYIEPELFEKYAEYGRSAGIKEVYSGPMVRSSYNAGELWKNFTE